METSGEVGEKMGGGMTKRGGEMMEHAHARPGEEEQLCKPGY